MSTRKTTKEKQAAAERKLEAALSLSEKSTEIGVDIIKDLEHQKEKQLASIDNVESTEYLLQQSMRTLRGMTWGGYFYNLVSNEGKLKPAATTLDPPTRNSDISERLSSSTGPGSAGVKQGQASVTDSLGPNPSAVTSKKEKQDQHVAQLSQSITNLHDVSVSIGQSLEEHDEITNSLTDKLNDTNDYALSVTLRTAQMTQRSTASQAVLVGEYKFKTLHNNYLSVFDDSITLTPQFNWSTVFRVYVKENNLYALQNVKTRRFLGLNFFGNVVVTSTGFGRNQEMFIDLTGKTGILFLASNWGSGGWLKPDKNGLLRTVSTNLLDREDRLLLTPFELTDVDYKKLKNM